MDTKTGRYDEKTLAREGKLYEKLQIREWVQRKARLRRISPKKNILKNRLGKRMKGGTAATRDLAQGGGKEGKKGDNVGRRGSHG